MRIVKIEHFIKKGAFARSKEYEALLDEVCQAVKTVVWFHQKKFIDNPSRKENGVNLIKQNFIAHLRSVGWSTEKSMSLAKGMNPGPIDGTKQTSKGIFAIEWETGNISSSHRALNKIAVGIIQKQIIGGILVLPIRELSRYLTDRIGNFEELSPYFPLYKALNINEGIIAVIAISYDGTSINSPKIPKGKDGNSKKKRTKRRKISKQK